MYKLIYLLIGLVLSGVPSMAQTGDSLYFGKEIRYLLEKYKENSPDYLRGQTQAEWDRKVEELFRQVDSARTQQEYFSALRYFAPLIKDYHTEFPDGGFYNRNVLWSKQDTLFPVWTRSTTDGRLFCVKDYRGYLTEGDEIISINGISVKDLVLKQHYLQYGEEKYAHAWIDEQEEGDVRLWFSFRNHLYFEQIHSPYRIEFIHQNKEKGKITVSGMTRDELYKVYKKSGDKKIVHKKTGWAQKPVLYKAVNDSIAILDINIFFGKNFLQWMIFRRDIRYNRLLKNGMKEVAKNNIKHLIIDLRHNPGGYAESMLNTFDYLMDSSYQDYVSYYKVTEETKTRAVPLIKNSHKDLYGKKEKENREKTLQMFRDSPVGTLFPLDTLGAVERIPKVSKYKYHGKVYVLTNTLSFSASVCFSNLVRDYYIAPIIGETPGAYSIMNGGPRVNICPLFSDIIRMNVSYSIEYSPFNRKSKDYHYIEPDLPLDDIQDIITNDLPLPEEKIIWIINELRGFWDK